MSDTIWKSTAVLLKVSWLVRFFVGNNGTRTEPTMRQRCQYLVATTHPFSSSRAPPVTKHKNLTYTPFKAYRVAPTLTRQCVPHPQSRRPRATHKVASTMYDHARLTPPSPSRHTATSETLDARRHLVPPSSLPSPHARLVTAQRRHPNENR